MPTGGLRRAWGRVVRRGGRGNKKRPTNGKPPHSGANLPPWTFPRRCRKKAAPSGEAERRLSGGKVSQAEAVQGAGLEPAISSL